MEFSWPTQWNPKITVVSWFLFWKANQMEELNSYSEKQEIFQQLPLHEKPVKLVGGTCNFTEPVWDVATCHISSCCFRLVSSGHQWICLVVRKSLGALLLVWWVLQSLRTKWDLWSLPRWAAALSTWQGPDRAGRPSSTTFVWQWEFIYRFQVLVHV